MLEAPFQFHHIRAQFPQLFQDACGSMQDLMWHKKQQAVADCIHAIVETSETSVIQIRPHRPCWLNGHSKVLFNSWK